MAEELRGLVERYREVTDQVAALEKERNELELAIDAAMGDSDEAAVEGIGTVQLERTARRSGWKTDDLRRVVLDSRRVDENGEAIDETPVDKLLHVWSLGAPRLTALREREIDPDDYSSSKPGPPKIKIT
jgi:hypothetical protein